MALEIYAPIQDLPQLTPEQLRDELCHAAERIGELSTHNRRLAGKLLCVVKCLRNLCRILSAQPPTSLTYFAGQELLTAQREAEEVLKLCNGIE